MTKELWAALEPLLDTSLSFLAEKFRRRGITLERRFSAAPTIFGDGEKLQQLFLNLLLNAADAMPQGGTVVVSLDASPEGGAAVRITDTGTGIEPARRFILSHFGPLVTSAGDRAAEASFTDDWKSALQEWLQAAGRGLPQYRLAGSEGPDHRKRFEVEVLVGGQRVADHRQQRLVVEPHGDVAEQPVVGVGDGELDPATGRR